MLHREVVAEIHTKHINSLHRGLLLSRGNRLLPSSCPSVSPSPTCISAAPTLRISVKFDNGDFYVNLSTKSKFE
jgi:hypothetical protein